MTLKIEWAPDYPGYTVFTADNYVVNRNSNETTQLLLDNGKHDILLTKGSKVYVMNDRGSTVDTIYQ